MILRQREFGIISNLREKVSNRLDKASIDSLNKFQDARNLIDNKTRLSLDSDKKGKLLKLAEDEGVVVVGGRPMSKPKKLILGKDPRVNYSPHSSYVRLTGKRKMSLKREKFGEKVLDKLKNSPKAYNQMTQFNNDIDKIINHKGNGVVFLNPTTSGDDTLAHELGHHMNHSSRNPLKRLSAELYPKVSLKRKKFKDIPKNRMVIEGLKGLLGSKVINYNEASASKNGISLLKRAGASPEELNMASKYLKAAYNTYKYGQKSTCLKLLACGIRPKK